MPPMIAPAVDFARQAGVTLVVETGNGTMVNSNYTARKLIDELDAKDTLKVLWTPLSIAGVMNWPILTATTGA